MQKRILLCVVVPAGCLLHGMCAAGQSETVAETFVSAIRNSRLAMSEGRVILESRMSRTIDGALRPVSKTVYTCFFQGSQLRMDRTIVRIGDSGAEGEILRETTILNESGDYLHNATAPGAPRVVATIVRASAPDARKKSFRSRVWDVRMLGLCIDPFPTLHAFSDWDKVMSSGHPERLSLDAETNRLTLNHPAGTQIFYCDRNRDNLPTRIEHETPVSRTVATISPGRWPSASGDPVWFPKTATVTRTRLDGTVTLENRCIVIEADFQSKPPADTFTVAGLGLKPGHVVQEYPAEARTALEWTGRDLAAFTGHRPQPPVLRNTGSRWTIAVTVLANVLLASGGLALWMWRRKHSSTAE